MNIARFREVKSNNETKNFILWCNMTKRVPRETAANALEKEMYEWQKSRNAKNLYKSDMRLLKRANLLNQIDAFRSPSELAKKGIKPTITALLQEIEQLKNQISGKKIVTKRIGERIVQVGKKSSGDRITRCEWYKKDWEKRSYIQESDLLGYIYYRNDNGVDRIFGIENIGTYPSGHKKYICRMQAADGLWKRIIALWDSAKNIRKIALNKGVKE
jgi:hypothetical protein